MNQQMIRPYTAALYTLQDQFLTVLKGAGAEKAGQITEVEMTLKDDGTHELSFSVPMKIREKGELVYNPVWWTVEQGNLIAGLRKVKIIFGDKVEFVDNDSKISASQDDDLLTIFDGKLLVKTHTGTLVAKEETQIDNDVFEFIITNVTEEHSDGILTCSVECEDLAFNELGKNGYKISLSEDDYMMDYTAYTDGILSLVNPFYDLPLKYVNKDDFKGYTADLIFEGEDEFELKLTLGSGYNIEPFKPYEFSFVSSDYCSFTIGSKSYSSSAGAIKIEVTFTEEDIKNNQLYIPIVFSNVGDITVSSFALKTTKEILPTIDYWMDKVVLNTGWTYSVQMDWTGYDGVIDELDSDLSEIVGNYSYDELKYGTRNSLNNKREEKELRRHDKIYEDEYVSEWVIEGDKVVPNKYEKFKEKCRIVDGYESNRYNLSRDIAEKFEVNSCYRYLHDANLRIIGKEIIFYNNLLRDKEPIDINYPYDTSEISREMDSSDVVTKLYVKDIDDDTNLVSGKISIADAPANKSGEDYILNFDYLYEIGSITEDQYQEIDIFENKMAIINKDLINLTEQIAVLKTNLTKQQALVSSNSNKIIEADEQIEYANNMIKAILLDTSEDSSKYYTEIGGKNYDTAYVLQDTDGKTYITIRKSGVIAESVKIYEDYALENLLGGVDAESVKKVSESSSSFYCSIRANTKVYLQYKYSPATYWTGVKESYEQAKATALTEKNGAEELVLALERDISDLTAKKNALLDKKQITISQFDRIMGAAIREGNWQSDEYKDYGNKKSITLTIDESPSDEIEFVFDEQGFDGEQKNYYESSVNKIPVYYYRIEMTPDLLSKLDKDLCFACGDCWRKLPATNIDITYTDDYRDIVSVRYDLDGETNSVNGVWNSTTTYTEDTVVYANGAIYVCTASNRNKAPASYDTPSTYYIDSKLICSYVKNKDSNKIIPVLIVLEDVEVLKEVLNINPRFTKVKTFIQNGELYTNEPEIIKKNIIPQVGNENEITVYPRIGIYNMEIKSSEIPTISINGYENLEQYTEYSMLPRFAENVDDTDVYYLSIKPYTLMGYGALDKLEFEIKYSISNASTSLYLDAKKVSKENAWPQVSYTVKINAINKELVSNLYSYLNYICHINDAELQFKNVRGYISEIKLILDEPWEDDITIQNYKTKFEDLFSSIVAATETVKANGTAYTKVANSFLSDGTLKPEVLQESIASGTINYDFDSGSLSISESNGIWAVNEDGVVAMRGGGISVANQKDEEGNWLWNTGITPNGINASLIQAGQLNTENIYIYAGNNIAFQMNADGLFAYRKKDEEISPLEYVVHNGEGLFLTNKKGYEYLDAYGMTKVLDEDIDRVEVSWDGLIIRNMENEKVFYADTDGNLTIAGKIEANSGHIGDWIIEKGGLVSDSLDFGIIPDSEDSVFWINGDENSFSIGSDGIVHATSILLDGALIANEATISGVPISELIKRSGIDKGIFKTELLGNVFKINALNEVNDLKYIITAYDVDVDFENTDVYLQEFNDECYEQYNFGEEEDYREFDEFNLPIVGECVSYEGKVYRCINNENDNSWIYKDIEDIEENYEQEFDEYLLFTLKYNIMNMDGQKVFRFMAEGEDGEIYYTENFTILAVVDGASPYVCKIEVLSGGTIFKNNKGSLSLIARVFDNLGEVDEYEKDKEEYLFNYAWVNASEPEIVLGNEKIFSCSDISEVTTITCQVSLKD